MLNHFFDSGKIYIILALEKQQLGITLLRIGCQGKTALQKSCFLKMQVDDLRLNDCIFVDTCAIPKTAQFARFFSMNDSYLKLFAARKGQVSV